MDKRLEKRNRVIFEHNQGEFWKPCPGTSAGYECCGYQIVTPMTGCGMYCRFCVLQVYLQREEQIIYTNWDDFERELREKMARWKGVVRFGTGEFADSLYLEKNYGISQKVAALLGQYPNAIVEFKTKSDNIHPLIDTTDPSGVILGFSLNTPAMIRALEINTASLEKRLIAIEASIRAGFPVALHFDPMVWYPQWEKDYRDLVRSVFQAIPDPTRIAWWSMGGFRTMPSLKTRLAETGELFPLFAGEMVLGADKKFRYFRSIRTAFYRAIREEATACYRDVPLYLCMESPEIWEDSGMRERAPHGLKFFLDDRARHLLNYYK